MTAEKKNLILVFSLIVITAIGGVVVLTAFDLAKKDSIGFEIIKLLGQVLFVGVLGVIISLFVQNYNRQRDKEVLINDLRKTVLTDLIAAYSDTKRARRIIMGNRLSNGMLPYKIYDEQMRNIIATQLALELLNHQIKTFQTYFGKDVDEKIISNVIKMDKYLGNIIDEYKDALKEESQIPETVALSSLPTMSSTMSRENEVNNFGKEFVTSYRTAIAEIRQQILS